MPDFGGKKLHFIQIGLGTNSTFIHNLAGDSKDWDKTISWCFSACSERDPQKVLGISIEPLESLVEEIRPVASGLPGVHLLQAAMGEHDETGAEMKGMSEASREELLNQAPPAKRQKLTEELEYLRNMSCLGYVHPLTAMCQDNIEKNYDLKLDIGCNQKVDVWSWRKLTESFNFVGCEVVLVDAEGCDTKILRSLISFCKENPDHWPDLIQFETMGHCDRQEGIGSEKALLETLENLGYTSVAISDHNSHVMNSAALEREKRLERWVYKWYCYICYEQWVLPYVSNKLGIFCQGCFDQLIARGRTKELKIRGYGQLDDLGACPTKWDSTRDETWYDLGYHWRTNDWKPWEREEQEEEQSTCDATPWAEAREESTQAEAEVEPA